MFKIVKQELDCLSDIYLMAIRVSYTARELCKPLDILLAASLRM
jgi:hypothetical protein